MTEDTPKNMTQVRLEKLWKAAPFLLTAVAAPLVAFLISQGVERRDVEDLRADVLELQRTCICGHEVESFDSDLAKMDVVYVQVQVLQSQIKDLSELMKEIRSELRDVREEQKRTTP